MIVNRTAPLAARPRFFHDPAGTLGPQLVGRCSMTVVSMVMWSVWAAFALFLAVLFIYRSSLTRDEEDQIFLDDSFDHEKAQQAVIMAKVARVEPLVRVALWMVAAMSAVVVAYYIRDILLQLNIIH